jgi:hypothetical protein
MALKTLSKTNILNGNIVQAADVSQSIDAFTGIEGYAISLSGSFTFSGATTGSGVFQNAVNALSSSAVYIASNSSTDANYTLVFKNDTFGLDGFHPLAADGTNGPYYNPSTNILGGTGGITVSGSIGKFTSITGSLSGSVNGTASFATSASQAITASYADNGVNSLTVGAFYDTTTQTLATNVSASMTFNSTTVSDGISVASNSRLTVTKSGTYNIQFSAQFVPQGPGSSVYVWLRKNGTNVTYSNTEIHMQNANNAVVAAWNFVETLTPGQYVELIWYPVGGTVDMAAEVPTPGSGGNGNVGIPSVIVTMTQIK